MVMKHPDRDVKKKLNLKGSHSLWQPNCSSPNKFIDEIPPFPCMLNANLWWKTDMRSVVHAVSDVNPFQRRQRVMELQLKGQVAIITGGAGGFGQAIAEAYAREGVQTVIADIVLDAAQTLADRLNASYPASRSLAVHTDVTQKASVEQMAQTTIDHFGRLDILVNNAGLIKRRKVLEIDDDFWDKMMTINLRGAIYASQACIPYMADERYGGRQYGRIIMMSSSSADHASAGMTLYSTTKIGLEMLGQAISKEHGHQNIFALFPRFGVAPTPGWDFPSYADSIGLEYDPNRPDDARRAVVEYYSKQMPLGKVGTPEEVARIVVLCSSHVMEPCINQSINAWWGRG
ncbi:SDR family NAD(P)-dependent oxidoreductase [candidate division KSB3 bacterium]|uniref:SDR family NAD(P)-dependent oxidoreductase n=1 Tax=candidate division KSB3 bacterium TaxID=2044937 RepID=A0A9D5JXK3_9BACT|nr:SDR family NAD(P)-dependent oxidoreductase [candidate division KSB3 bacterium]MBD3325975.1 SDR family NAD(P)-dependent oxidoreductase [candidate division KSB3 bacterium]